MNSSTLLSRMLLTGISLFAGVQMTSAQAIAYSGISNVDMLIANIFGVQCEGVTNVQVMGSGASIGRFDYGQGIGLNGGMMLSTGFAPSYSLMPYSIFASGNTNMPGDMDIINYGNLSGTGATSFDAISVQFDFTPLVSDSIRFTYVFASEEYPEYSNSAFNDRFMFLVSENGATPYNIAQVPGTTTTVEINSINQLINSQYYVDNSTVPSGAYFVFDGYTVPLQATFYAQVGSVYHIKLVISDIADGIFDSAIFLDEQESYNNIEGGLTVNGLPAEGVLEVFNFVDDTLLATPVDSIVVTGGTYVADSLTSGMYHVRFTPDPILFPGAIPLYFQTGSSWSTADPIGLPCYLNNADIDADTVDGNDGTGTISGYISIDTTFLKTTTVPFAGAYVQLVDQVTHETKAFAFTGADGNYTMTGVPAGAFYVLVDVPYIPQSDTHMVTINNNNVIGEDFDYAILPDGIITDADPVLGMNEADQLQFTMHPNPANENLFVSIQATEEQPVRIMTVNGQMLQSSLIGGGVQTISTKALANGVYLLQIGNSQPQRLVVQH